MNYTILINTSWKTKASRGNTSGRIDQRQATECCVLNPLTPTVAIMGTAIMHPVLDRVKPSFVVFDIRALWRSGLSVRVPGCQKLQTAAA